MGSVAEHAASWTGHLTHCSLPDLPSVAEAMSLIRQQKGWSFLAGLGAGGASYVYLQVWCNIASVASMISATLFNATLLLPALPAEVDMARDCTCSRQEPQPARACTSSGCELSPMKTLTDFLLAGANSQPVLPCFSLLSHCLEPQNGHM